jgi:hypothetical protein
MTQGLDHDALKRACLEVAKSIAWRDGPVDDILASTFSEILYKEALYHEEFIAGQDRDPNLITRAVSYLAHAHAIPPMRLDISWFRDMLAALIELICPNSAGREEDMQFYQDIEDGLRILREDHAT